MYRSTAHKILIFLLALLMAFSLSSCGKDEEGGGIFNGNQDKEAVFETGNTIYVAITKLETLNPVIANDEDYFSIEKLLYSSPYTLDTQLVPQKDLAVNYSYNPENRVAELSLRPDVLWSDGNALDAYDVKFTIDTYKAMGYACPYYDYVSNMSSVAVKNGDRNTLVIAYGSDHATGCENLIFPILPSHTHKNSASFAADRKNFIPVSSGQYVVESYDYINDLILIPNENYYGAKAENRLIFNIVPDKRNALNLSSIGEVTAVYSTDYDRETLISSLKLEMTNKPSQCTEVIGFNLGDGSIMSESSMRQAFAYMTDNNYILQAVYYMSGVMTDSVFYPGYLGTENGGDAYKYDLHKAAALFAAYGYSDTDGDGLLDMDGKPLVIRLLANSGDKLRVSAAESIKQTALKCGVTVEVVQASGEEYSALIAERKYDAFIGTVKMNERMDVRPIYRTGMNSIGYSNPAADKIMDRLAEYGDAYEKQGDIEELKQILSQDLPYYPLFCRTCGVAYMPELAGDRGFMFNDVYMNASSWYTEKEITE